MHDQSNVLDQVTYCRDAGGMSKWGAFGIPMTQRVGLRDGVDPSPARHCWVLDPAATPGASAPVPWLSGTTPTMTSGWDGSSSPRSSGPASG